MGELSPWHWLIVVIIFVALFGSARLPSLARSLGQSMRILKAELGGREETAEQTPATRIEVKPAPPPQGEVPPSTRDGGTSSPDRAPAPPPAGS